MKACHVECALKNYIKKMKRKLDRQLLKRLWESDNENKMYMIQWRKERKKCSNDWNNCIGILFREKQKNVSM